MICWLQHDKEQLWVKWVHSLYMNEGEDLWVHQVPKDCSWYWKQLNMLKLCKQDSYSQGAYNLTATTKYPIARGYIDLTGNRPAMRGSELIWCKLLPKHRFLLWVAMQKKLLTRERLQRMGVQCDHNSCVLCDQDQFETSSHLFVQCEAVCALWRRIESWIETA